MKQDMNELAKQMRQMIQEDKFRKQLTDALLAFIEPAKTMADLYKRLDVHHRMTARSLRINQGRRETVFGHQWRERVYSKDHPGRLTQIAAGTRRAIEMMKAEYRNEIPTLHPEDIIK